MPNSKEEYIKTFEGVIIGIVETNSNGDQTVRNFPARQVVAKYDHNRDVTTDFYGRIIAKGNAAVAPLYSKK